MRDAEEIRHDARRPRSTAADARRARRDGLDDEEIVGEALVPDDRELAVEPRAHPGGRPLAVAMEDPRLAARAEDRERVAPLEWIGREDRSPHGPVDRA